MTLQYSIDSKLDGKLYFSRDTKYSGKWKRYDKLNAETREKSINREWPNNKSIFIHRFFFISSNLFVIEKFYTTWFQT